MISGSRCALRISKTRNWTTKPIGGNSPRYTFLDELIHLPDVIRAADLAKMKGSRPSQEALAELIAGEFEELTG